MDATSIAAKGDVILMYDELIKRLREAPSNWPDAELHYEAADAIEKLIEVIQNHDFLESLIKPDWIPVTERLPEPMKDVVLFMRYGEYKQLSEFAVGYYDDKLSDFSYCDVTHWMPLPEPPGEEARDA